MPESDLPEHERCPFWINSVGMESLLPKDQFDAFNCLEDCPRVFSDPDCSHAMSSIVSGRSHFMHPFALIFLGESSDMASVVCRKPSDGCRFGEADHPGPLRVGAFNPHQLYNKENVVIEWGVESGLVLKLLTLWMPCGCHKVGLGKRPEVPFGVHRFRSILRMLD